MRGACATLPPRGPILRLPGRFQLARRGQAGQCPILVMSALACQPPIRPESEPPGSTPNRPPNNRGCSLSGRRARSPDHHLRLWPPEAVPQKQADGPALARVARPDRPGVQGTAGSHWTETAAERDPEWCGRRLGVRGASHVAGWDRGGLSLMMTWPPEIGPDEPGHFGRGEVAAEREAAPLCV